MKTSHLGVKMTEKKKHFFSVPKNIKKMTEEETRVHFLGRLANYKYFNMDAAILNALDYYDTNFNFSL
jgi:UDP-galactopyranose mutase